MAKNELPVPVQAAADESARELVRVWAAGGQQHVALASGLWHDPGAWGIVLADLSRHLARAYVQTEGMAESDVLRRIREAFDAEWNRPTDKPKGSALRNGN